LTTVFPRAYNPPVRTTSAILLLLALAWPVCGQETPKAPIATGRLAVAAREYDAGKVDRGTTVVHTFLLKNVGAAELSVDAKPGWGCTLTEFDKVIPPGGVGKVTASLDTAHYQGPITKSVRVTTNDPTAGVVDLLLKAEIVTVIDVTPAGNPVVRTANGATKAELTVSAVDGKPFDILAVQADPTVDVTVAPPPDAKRAAAKRKRAGTAPVASGSNRYVVTVVARDDAPAAHSLASVTLSTDRPKAKTVPIHVILFPLRPVQVTPDRLVVQPVSDGSALHAKLRKPTGDPLEILAVESSAPDFTATATAVTPGREYDIAVRYTGQPGRGMVNARITVRTNDPQQGTIVIPLVGHL
jgi:hypothetical protein